MQRAVVERGLWRRRAAWTILTLAAALLGCGSGADGAGQGPVAVDAPSLSSPEGFDHSLFGAVLVEHLDNASRVDYAALQADRADLDRYVAALAAVSPADYAAWSRTEKIAFWINAYNALTLAAVINHYPIRPSLLRSVVYPKNSIRQIPGVWDELTWTVMGREVTLDEIEHRILRAEFGEARIHMALVCAAMSCPPLRWEPYTGERLDGQLEDQTVRFLGNGENFRLDPDGKRVYLSSIFSWFGEDFIEFYGTDEAFTGRSPAERAVLSFIARRLEGPMREFIDSEDYDIEYVDYDWTLNEQPERSP